MNTEIRKMLTGLRDFIAYWAKITPTKYDDQLVSLLDFLLGSESQAHAQVIGIDWEKVVEMLLPYLMQLIAKWLQELGNNGHSPSITYNPGTTPRC